MFTNGLIDTQVQSNHQKSANYQKKHYSMRLKHEGKPTKRDKRRRFLTKRSFHSTNTSARNWPS